MKKKNKVIIIDAKSILKKNEKYKNLKEMNDDISILFYTLKGVEYNKGFIYKLKKALKFKRKEKPEKPQIPEGVERFSPSFQEGLTEEQVKSRIKANLTNNTKVKSTKSYTSIFIKNIFTFFNMLWLIIAVALFVVGSYGDLMFLFVIVANTAIAIIQEIRAKIAVEKLSMVSTPLVKTIRNGMEIDLQANKLVLDDIIKLTTGNQIPADCIIIDGKVEVNESLLTGESNSIEKSINAPLLSGSFVVSGICYAKIEKIGRDNYIYQMAKKAKEFKAPESNLFKDLNRLIKYIGIALVPIGILTFLKEFAIEGSTLKQQITNTSGALISMIPAGMFLLVTIALAVGVVKLTKKKTLVKDLYSIEMLARTNVLCLDKTGTITDGTMKVVDFITYTKKRKTSISKLLANVLGAQKTENSTSNALIKEFGKAQDFVINNIAEFSSEKKYSITELSNKKIYFLGAHTRIGCSLTAEQLEYIKLQQNKGLRVLAFSELENEQFDKNMSGKKSTLLALIIIEEKIRDEAIETIQWFKDNGVEIKIISGDDPATVAKIAQRVGVEDSDKYISLENKSIKEVEVLTNEFTVFGRVTPEQKYTIIKSLKNKGNVVAMTGDGVNDTLALKEADCSIAMADGSEVARSISKLVLLESNFSSLPSVVKEGRQVVNNVQNSSSLFLMKTFFAIILTILTLFLQLPYPFIPRMMMPLEAFVIGIPSFLLTFEPNNKPIKGNFIPQVLKRSLPRALLLLINIIIVMMIHYTQLSQTLTHDEYQTLVVLVLTYTGFLNLASLCYPFTLLRIITLSVSLVCITGAIAGLPKLFSITTWSLEVLLIFFSLIVVSIIILIAIRLNRKGLNKLRDKIINLLQK